MVTGKPETEEMGTPVTGLIKLKLFSVIGIPVLIVFRFR